MSSYVAKRSFLDEGQGVHLSEIRTEVEDVLRDCSALGEQRLEGLFQDPGALSRFLRSGMVSLLLNGSPVQSRAAGHCQGMCVTTAP